MNEPPSAALPIVPRVLLAWELGEGLGHLVPLFALAASLRATGVTPVFAVRDPAAARRFRGSAAFEIVQAPYWPDPQPARGPSRGYINILHANGFHDATALGGLLDAWDGVIAQTGASALVCEHAPSAVVAAFGRLPVSIIGNGYLLPPADGADFPPMRPDADDPVPAVLAAIQGAMAARPGGAPDCVTAPFRAAHRYVTSFPALDPYRASRRDAVIGPLEPMPAPTPAPHGGKLFAYMARDWPRFGDLLQALMALGPRAGVFTPGLSQAQATLLRSRGVHVFDGPPPLDQLLPRVRAVLSHGGTGTAHAALAACRAHLIAPRHDEAWTTLRLLEATGAGFALPAGGAAEIVTACLGALGDDALAARAFAAGKDACGGIAPGAAETLASAIAESAQRHRARGL